MTTSAIACPICGGDMKISVTTNRNGKHAIGVHCPADGRHFRGFINHKPYVEEVLSQIVEAATAQSSAGTLQSGSGTGSPVTTAAPSGKGAVR